MPPEERATKRFLPTFSAFLAIMAVCILRALPAFERGTYATEGGEWLSRMWVKGFWAMIFGARGDYGVLGNMLVIKGADLMTQIVGGHSLAACGPAMQHVFACLYVALIFTFAFAVLRTYHGWWRAALITALMLLAPDLDGENRVFGEANNVGFFNALGIVFLYYDVWMRQRLSTARTVAYALLILVHLLTSPMAGLVAAGFCALLIARSLWQWKKESQPLPAILWLHVATILLAAWTIHQAKPETSDPNSEVIAHTAAVVMPRFWKTFVELALCRQLLYPLTLNFYEHFTDGRTLVLFLVVVGAIAWWIKAEIRAAKGKPDWMRLALTLLIFAIAFSMSAVTLWSRGWLTQADQAYTKIWPARYYLVQTMLSAGFIGMIILRFGDLYPRFRRDAVTLAVLMAASFAVPQIAPIRSFLNHGDPHVPAKRWSNQLARVHDAHAHDKSSTGDIYAVEMYVEHHFVHVPASMVDEFFARPQKPRSDLCEAALVDASNIKSDESHRQSRLQIEELRAIPRSGGTLVTFDAMLNDQPHFSRSRRHLWIGNIEGSPKITATTYDVLVPRVQELSKKRLNDIERLLFKVQLWFDKELTAAQTKTLLTGIPVAIGVRPDEIIARGMIQVPGDDLALSALPDDETSSNLHPPLKQLFHWAGKGKEFKLHNVIADKRGLSMADDAAFDEQAYVRLNPDVASALEAKAITSGKAHYEHWGRNEPRQIATYSVALDVSKSALSTDHISGLRIEVTRRKDRPQALRCILHGPKGEQSVMTIVPSEGEGVFEVYRLPPHFFPQVHPVQTLEIELEHPQRDREFRIEDIFIYE